MKKVIIIILAVSLTLPVFSQFLDPDNPKYANEKPLFGNRNKKDKVSSNFEKSSGTYLRQAGILMYISYGVAGIGGCVSYLGNESIRDVFTGELSVAEIQDKAKQMNIINRVSTGIYITAAAINLIAIAKIIKAGSVLEAERKEYKKQFSFNYTGNGLTLAYRF